MPLKQALASNVIFLIGEGILLASKYKVDPQNSFPSLSSHRFGIQNIILELHLKANSTLTLPFP